MPGQTPKLIQAARKMPIYEVTWLDACVDGGWKPVAEYQKIALLECQAVGYVTKKTRNEIQLVQQRNDNKVSDSVTIPLSCVKHIRRLR